MRVTWLIGYDFLMLALGFSKGKRAEQGQDRGFERPAGLAAVQTIAILFC